MSAELYNDYPLPPIFPLEKEVNGLPTSFFMLVAAVVKVEQRKVFPRLGQLLSSVANCCRNLRPNFAKLGAEL
jgi:hypothetical protein